MLFYHGNFSWASYRLEREMRIHKLPIPAPTGTTQPLVPRKEREERPGYCEKVGSFSRRTEVRARNRKNMGMRTGDA
jgi:hypothetical protein